GVQLHEQLPGGYRIAVPNRDLTDPARDLCDQNRVPPRRRLSRRGHGDHERIPNDLRPGNRDRDVRGERCRGRDFRPFAARARSRTLLRLPSPNAPVDPPRHHEDDENGEAESERTFAQRHVTQWLKFGVKPGPGYEATAGRGATYARPPGAAIMFWAADASGIRPPRDPRVFQTIERV